MVHSLILHGLALFRCKHRDSPSFLARARAVGCSYVSGVEGEYWVGFGRFVGGFGSLRQFVARQPTKNLAIELGWNNNKNALREPFAHKFTTNTRRGRTTTPPPIGRLLKGVFIPL